MITKTEILGECPIGCIEKITYIDIFGFKTERIIKVYTPIWSAFKFGDLPIERWTPFKTACEKIRIFSGEVSA